jgi:hypothetical protein
MPGWAGLTMSDEILNFYYRGTAITIGANLYIRFLVSPSSRSGGGIETNYDGYTRYEIIRGTALFGSASSGGRLTNTAEIELAVANSLGNGDLAWFDIVDTASGAFTKLYNGGPIIPPRSLVVGKAPVFGVSRLLITF